MLSALRPAIARLLTPVGELLARTPVTPNAITRVGTLGVAASALSLFPTGHLFVGTVVCTVFVLADMLDGALARVTGTSGSCGAGGSMIFDTDVLIWFLRGDGAAARLIESQSD